MPLAPGGVRLPGKKRQTNIVVNLEERAELVRLALDMELTTGEVITLLIRHTDPVSLREWIAECKAAEGRR